MRIFFGLLITLFIFVGTVRDVRAQYGNPQPATAQTSPSATAKCTVPPGTGDCHISKKKKEFIEWQAPPDKDMYVCFGSPYPFKKQCYHIRAGHRKSSGPVVLKPEPAVGTIFVYHYGDTNPPSEENKNTARVIIDE